MAIGILYVFLGFFRIFLGFTQYNHLLPKNSLTYDIDNMCFIIELTFLIKKNIFKVKILHFFFWKFFFEMLLGTYFAKTLWRLAIRSLSSRIVTGLATINWRIHEIRRTMEQEAYSRYNFNLLLFSNFLTLYLVIGQNVF